MFKRIATIAGLALALLGVLACEKRVQERDRGARSTLGLGRLIPVGRNDETVSRSRGGTPGDATLGGTLAGASGGGAGGAGGGGMAGRTTSRADSGSM
jgi:hypothetical protein